MEAILQKTNLDALCINESWWNSDGTNDQIRISGFKVYRLDSKAKRRGGGLCAYVAGKHKVNAHKYEELNVSNKNLEALVLEVQQKCTKAFTLIIAYRPPQGSTVECVEELKSILKGVNAEQEVCLLGDFNIDYSDHRLPATRNLKGICKEFNLKQPILMPTRVTSTTNTVLDHIYTNMDKVAHVGVIETFVSDHYPVYLVLKKKQLHYERVTFKYRQIKDLTTEILENKLLSVDWNDYYMEKDPEKCWKFMYDLLLQAFDDLCPIKEQVNVKRKAYWITAELFKLMRA